MIRSLLTVAVLWAYAGGAPASDPWNELIGVEAEIAQVMSRIDTVLAYQDLADRIAILQGQTTAADADARLKALGARLVKQEVGEPELADARARLGAAIAGYLDTVGREAASSNRWPGGAAQQTRAQGLLDAVRSSYPRFLQANLDPTLLIMQVALVAGWSRGESTVANPFAGHLQRMQDAYPDERTRARIAAANGPLVAPDGTPVATTPLTLPPPIAGERPIPGEMGGRQLPPPVNLQLEMDTDRPGMDLTSFDLEAADPALCLTACRDYGGCVSFTYVKPGVQGQAARCWLKGGVPAAVPSSCCISGLASGQMTAPAGSQLEMDTDRPGMDLTSFDLEAADPVACLTACQDYGGCVAFTYVKPGVQGPAARCWLKGGVPAAVSSSCCVSGTP